MMDPKSRNSGFDGGTNEPSSLIHRIDLLQTMIDDEIMTSTARKTVLRERTTASKTGMKLFIAELEQQLRLFAVSFEHEIDDFVSTEETRISKRNEDLSNLTIAMRRKREAIVSLRDDAGKRREYGNEFMSSCAAFVSKSFEQIKNIDQPNYLPIEFVPRIQVTIRQDDIGYIKFCDIDPATVDIVLNMKEDNKVSAVCGEVEMALIHTNTLYDPHALQFLTIRIADPRGDEVPVTIEDNHNGSYFALFTPYTTGMHIFEVKFFGVDVNDSPMKIEVVGGNSTDVIDDSCITRTTQWVTGASITAAMGNSSSHNAGSSYASQSSSESDVTLRGFSSTRGQNIKRGGEQRQCNQRSTFGGFPQLERNNNNDENHGRYTFDKNNDRPFDNNERWKHDRFDEFQCYRPPSPGCANEQRFVQVRDPFGEDNVRSLSPALSIPPPIPTKEWCEKFGHPADDVKRPKKKKATAVPAVFDASIPVVGMGMNSDVFVFGQDAAPRTGAASINNASAVFGQNNNLSLIGSSSSSTASTVVSQNHLPLAGSGSINNRSTGTNANHDTFVGKFANLVVDVPANNEVKDTRVFGAEAGFCVKELGLARWDCNDSNDPGFVKSTCGAPVMLKPQVDSKSVLQLYIDQGRDTVVVKTQFICQCGQQQGLGPEALFMPIGVTANHTGDVIVCDTRHNLVKLFDMTGKWKRTIDAEKNGRAFLRPSAAVCNERGDIFVKDDNSIQVFDSRSNHSRIIGQGILHRPYGLSMNMDSSVTVFDHGLGSSGASLITFTQNGDLVNQSAFGPLLSGAMPVADLRKSKCRFLTSYWDSVFVVDLGRSVVYKTTFDGLLLKTFGSFGRSPGLFNEPSGITADSSGNLLIADSRNDRIQLFNVDGEAKGHVALAQEIIRPSDIHLTSDGLLLVSNYLKHCIKVFKIVPP